MTQHSDENVEIAINIEDRLFNNHYNYYKGVGVETIKQQAGQIEQVSSDYQGRVIYELLQNAFDKAHGKILVQVFENSLYVANDGTKFNYMSDYDYDNGSTERGDFQSMCSISTSTKNVSSSIGNKGVGFKSAFSIAKDNYVNIYTLGEIINNNQTIEKEINFRLYDSFKDLDSIPSAFPVDVSNDIREKIILMHKERKDRGIPGYYFPLHIKHKSKFIEQLFRNGLVTIIEIPIDNKEYILQLFNEIKNVHFEFVKLKYNHYPANFNIEFIFDNDKFIKEIGFKKNSFYSAKITSPEIINLAKTAGVNVDKLEIGIMLKDKPDGVFYNYLPTKAVSPFKYVDFHADFHTTVDRKSINFDGKIGEYNTALYNVCIEFYFILLNNYNTADKSNLNTYFFHQNKINQSITFDPRYLEYKYEYKLHYIIKSILRIDNYAYDSATKFLCCIATKYFEKKRLPQQHQKFINTTLDFITAFSRFDGQEYKWTDIFKSVFAKEIKAKKINLIPNVSISDISELLFRKKSDSKLDLPPFLGINITDFEIKDVNFRKAIGIKDFTDYNEILKYFKQCTFDGKYSSRRITEEEQKKLIQSIYSIFIIKNEQSLLSTHRITKAINSYSRDANSSLNQANFNISTVFLKTKDGKYKPAQLCRLHELDEEFISLCVGNKKEAFLKYIGVSLDSDYIYADSRLYDKLKNGVKTIPFLLDREEYKENISEELIRHISIISAKGNKKHPSTINNNDYRFLDKILKFSMKDELENLLVRRYDNFPKEYRDILRKRIQDNITLTSDIIRLYQNLFKTYETGKIFLVSLNRKLVWIDSHDFMIVSNKNDFDLAIQIPDRKILCFYSIQNIPPQYRHLLTIPRPGSITIEGGYEDKQIIDNIKSKIIYILLSISSSKNSEVDYLSDDKDLNDLYSTISTLKIIEGNNLKQELYFGNHLVTSDKSYAYEEKSKNILYFSSKMTKKEKSIGLGEFLFNNSSISELIELILFHKDIEDLKKEYNQEEVIIIRKKWKNDYSEKYLKFQKSILAIFGVKNIVDDNWFIYNSVHKSQFLIERANDESLEYLKEIILQHKNAEEFESYFENFQLEIDMSEIFERISKLTVKIELVEPDIQSNLLAKMASLEIKLGCEMDIKKIEDEVEKLLPQLIVIDNNKISTINKEITLQNKIDNIFNSLSMGLNKNIISTDLNGTTINKLIPKKMKKIIFQGNANQQNPQDLELMGSTGEERVLFYFILEFLKLSTPERLIGINSVYDLLKRKLNNNSMQRFKDKCINVLNNDSELKKALIPFFYVTMHYKYSYFDLIVYKDFKPTLIEVKTTYSNSNRFFLSIAEVDAARGNDNYEIVRDSPTSINFLGNPIKLIENNLVYINGENFSMIPRNYEFKFTS